MLMQRKYFNNCVGEIVKLPFCFYKWNFYIPKNEKPFKKGITLSLEKAMIKINKAYEWIVYEDIVLHWVVYI